MAEFLIVLRMPGTQHTTFMWETKARSQEHAISKTYKWTSAEVVEVFRKDAQTDPETESRS